jgi:hypothetical protein
MKKVCLSNITLHGSTRCFDLNLTEKIITDAPICESGSLNLMKAGGNYAILKPRLSKSSPFVVKIMIENARRGIYYYDKPKKIRRNLELCPIAQISLCS